MIEINLLPEDSRRKNIPSLNFNFEMGKVKLLAGGILAGVLVLLLVLPAAGSAIRKKQISNLMAKEQEISERRAQIEAVNSEISLLRARVNAFEGVLNRKFLWAKKLNEISDMVLPGIWFTRLTTVEGNTLVIEGSVISKKEEAMASVGKFMKDIRDNQDFFKDFSMIKLESVQRKSIDNRDVVDFRVVLYF